MKRRFTKEAQIGLVTIISLVLLYIGFNYLKGVNIFKPSNYFYVAFDNVKDITISTPVYVDGFKVGLVRSLQYDYNSKDKILVEISLEEKMKINKGSYVEAVKTLLSGAELHLRLNKYVDDYYKSGATLEGRLGPDMLNSLEANVMPKLAEILPRIDSLLVSLNTLVNHPSINQSLLNIEQTTAGLQASAGKLNRLLDQDVPVILTDLRNTTSNISSISTRIDQIDLGQSFALLDATLKNLKITTEQLNSTDNSLGLLLNDRELYYNLNKTAESASDFLIDLKKNPKKYVHFSLF